MATKLDFNKQCLCYMHGGKVYGNYAICHTTLIAFLLPLLGNCLPAFDEICRRSTNFIKSRVSHSSGLVRSIAMYSFTFSRCNSVICQNLLFCAQRTYNCLIQDILYGNVNSIIHNHSKSCVDVHQVQLANFLYELMMIKDT